MIADALDMSISLDWCFPAIKTREIASRLQIFPESLCFDMVARPKSFFCNGLRDRLCRPFGDDELAALRNEERLMRDCRAVAGTASFGCHGLNSTCATPIEPFDPRFRPTTSESIM